MNSRHDKNFLVGREDVNSRVAAYESYLDLFTLLSFILIISAFVYVASKEIKQEGVVTNDPPQNPTNYYSQGMLAKLVSPGSGGVQAMPKDRLLLVVFRENSIDKLGIVDGLSGFTNQHLTLTIDNYSQVMEGLVPRFDNVKTIDIAAYKGKEDINPGIWLAVTRWLANHSYVYRVFYAGEK